MRKNIEQIVEELITLINEGGSFTDNGERLTRLDVFDVSEYIRELEDKVEKLETKEVIHLKVKKYRVYEDGSLNTGYIDEESYYFDNDEDMLNFSNAIRRELGFISILRKD